MIRLSDEQWERIRRHFPDEDIPDGRPGRTRFQRGACAKQACGFSTPARSGTCCRRAIRTTKPCIGGFRLGVKAKFCVKFSRMLPTKFATKGCWAKKRDSSP